MTTKRRIYEQIQLFRYDEKIQMIERVKSESLPDAINEIMLDDLGEEVELDEDMTERGFWRRGRKE